YCDSKIYFHSAKAGHKIDALEKNDKVSFCVVDADNIVPEKFTTYFRSVIVFGKARVLRDEEKRFALELLIDKYSKEFSNNKEAEISGSFNAVSCIELTIEHMSGKEAIEYIREKESNN
ncbi:MAG: pyridoxamine 5'-phosphate oxidase family protein, partial [Anaerorhabdus sp.]